LSAYLNAGRTILLDKFLRFATAWVENGVQIVGGCCDLSPDHIAALRPLKERDLARYSM